MRGCPRKGGRPAATDGWVSGPPRAERPSFRERSARRRRSEAVFLPDALDRRARRPAPIGSFGEILENGSVPLAAP